jgi:hypothetical protein
LKWYDGGGENGITSKRIFFKLKYFSPLRILTSPLFKETLGAFLFLPLLFFFCALSLEDLGVLMIFEEKITSLNGMAWNGMVMNMDILTVDAYSGMELCTSI